MASDISSIIKEDISGTLESLLSIKANIENSSATTSEDIGEQQCICVETDFEFSKFKTVKIKFYIPTKAATKFEYLMLGGATDLKDTIDDEILDAVNEIISNICGSISTNVNAQAYEDLGSLKFTISNKEIIECDSNKSLDNLYTLDLKLDDDAVVLFLEFDKDLNPYISLFSSDSSEITEAETFLPSVSHPLLELIGEDSLDNLKLLFDIKFKLSVRLGSKVVLLKDIMGWDTGTIIELEQMVNQPLDILVNGIKIGDGEAVIVEGKFGVKIKNIGTKIIN